MRKLFLLLLYVLLFVIYSSAYARSVTGSYPTLNTTNTMPNSVPGLTSGMVNYEDLSAYPYDITSPTLLWTRQGGSPGGQTVGEGIGKDNFGNVYVVGYTYGDGLYGQKQNGFWDSFIVKYDKESNLIWSRQLGAAGGSTWGTGISVDNLNNIYVTGYTDVGLNGQKQNGHNDYFIAKYESGGNLIWTRQVGGTYSTGYGGWTLGIGISTDESGSIYITGYTDVGISGQEQNGRNDYFIAKYESGGNLIWTRQVGARRGETYGSGISADESGSIYVTGSTTVGISGQLQNGSRDYFIAKYDQSGYIYWSRQVGTKNGYASGRGISAVKYINESGVKNENFGSIYVTGETYGGLSGQKQNGNSDYFIAKYYFSDGELIWSKQVGASGGLTTGDGISTDNSGNIYITGYTNVGLSGQTQKGIFDYFIARYDSHGKLLTTVPQVGAPFGTTSGHGINVDESGNIYVAGQTTVGISGQTQSGAWDYFIVRYINQLKIYLR